MNLSTSQFFELVAFLYGHFEAPVCKLYLLFISAYAAQEKEKKDKKVLLPTGISKSSAHAVLWYEIL
jgi:hypothetical protein